MKVNRKYQEDKTEIYGRIKKFLGNPPADGWQSKEWLDIVYDIKEFNARIFERDLVGIVTPISDRSIKQSLRRAFTPPKRERARAMRNARKQ